MAIAQPSTSRISVPTGDIKTAATQLLRWAHERSAIVPDAYYPGDGIGLPTFGPEPMGQTAVATLRQRQIRFVGVNPAAQTISVYLRRAAPTQKELRTLPSTCNGFTLQYHQGNPNTISPAVVAQAAATCAIRNGNAGAKFYTCGSSISVGNDRGAGTLGCLLQDAGGTLHGLSNNHVSASCNYAPHGLPILAPGVIDVSPVNPHPFTLGTHRLALPMLMGDATAVDYLSNTDAAVFQISAGAPISSMQRNHYDTPGSVATLVPGMSVQKVGRTTDLTSGVVLAELVGPLGISYAAPQYQFSGIVYFEPLFLVNGLADVFSDSGDSGSLVTHLDAHGVRHAVGLIVGGMDDSSAPGGKRSFVLPIKPILDRLAMTLVSAHNV